MKIEFFLPMIPPTVTQQEHKVVVSKKTGKSRFYDPPELKAARMNWNTYRRSGLGLFSSLYYMGCYAVNGIRKYRQL